MRIGLDVRAMQTQGVSAGRGIGRYIIDIVEGLLEYAPEDQVVLMVVEGRPVPQDWGERCETVPVGGMIPHEAEWPWYLKIPKVRSLPALQARFHDEAVASQRLAFETAVAKARLDVLHLPTAVDIGSYPEGTFDVPTVGTFLDAIPIVHRELIYDAWKPHERRFYDRQLANLRTLTRIVAISECSRQDAIRFGKVEPDRVDVVYPSVSPVYGVPVDVAPAREKYGLTAPFVLFCSVPDLHKNPFRIIEAFARVRPSLPAGTRLAFISPLKEPFESRLRGAAQEHGLGENDYVITGHIPEEDVVALFQAADCLISPSLLEGFGLPAAQAIAAGTPAIVSDRGSQPEVVGDSGLTVDPERTDAIADAIRRVMTDPKLRDDLSARGRVRSAMFAPEHQVAGLRMVYQAAIQDGKLPNMG